MERLKFNNFIVRSNIESLVVLIEKSQKSIFHSFF